MTEDKVMCRVKKLIDNEGRKGTDLVERNRALRKLDIDDDELRTDDLLDQDEILIKRRVIDESIKAVKPAYLRFINQSDRIVVFTHKTDPQFPAKLLEDTFTQGVRYQGWLKPWMQVTDGSLSHGWDAFEIELNPMKPFGFQFSHIGRENLIYPAGVKSLQDSDILLRKYGQVTLHVLNNYVDKYKFSETAVAKLKEKFKDTSEEKLITLYKVYTKVDSVVHIAWYSPDCDEWLKPAEMYRSGLVEQQLIQATTMGLLPTVSKIPTVVDRPISIYPVFQFTYEETEEEKPWHAVGRAFLDAPNQDAQTALMSAYVNGAVRSSEVYGSPETNRESGAIQQLDIELKGQRLYNQPLKFFSPPAPSEGLVRTVQILDTQNKQAQGMISAATNNRVDSRKTAAEVQSMQEMQNDLSGAALLSFSSFTLEVMTYIYEIVKSRVQTGLIQLAPEVSALFVDDLYITPAGSVDVVRRDQRIAEKQRIWPMIQGSSLANEFMKDILRDMFPQDYARYEQIINASSQDKQLIQELAGVISSIVYDENNIIRPEFAGIQKNLARLEEAVGARLAKV